MFLFVSSPHVELFTVRPDPRSQIAVAKLDLHAQDLVVDAPEREPRKGFAPSDLRVKRGVAQYQAEFYIADFFPKPSHQFDVERSQHDVRLASPRPNDLQRRKSGSRVLDLQV